MAEKKFPPYINAFNSIPILFSKIREASVPTKFTNDYLGSMLGLKSSSHRALIPLLKRIDFLDAAGSPTTAYREYRGEQGKSHILAEKIRKAYGDLYQSSEFLHTLDKKEIENKLVTLTGASKTDQAVPAVASTFLELVKLADFSDTPTKVLPPKMEEDKDSNKKPENNKFQETINQGNFGLSYTINLNLPPTTEIEVFNAIFKSLRENLLDK